MTHDFPGDSEPAYVGLAGGEEGVDIRGVEFDAIRWDRVRRLTIVPFLHDGSCLLIPVDDRLVLPSGEVLPGEDPMIEAGLRIPLVTAGFRRQGFHPFAVRDDHLYVWCEGDDRYRGSRPHAEVDLWKGSPVQAAGRSRRPRGSGVADEAATVSSRWWPPTTRRPRSPGRRPGP